jgi:hypothetical protein
MRLPALGSLSTEIRAGLFAIQRPTAPAYEPVTFVACLVGRRVKGDRVWCWCPHAWSNRDGDRPLAEPTLVS